MSEGRPAVVSGRLIDEPKLRRSGPGGAALLKMRLAVARRAEQGDYTAIVEASVRSGLAEICARTLRWARRWRCPAR